MGLHRLSIIYISLVWILLVAACTKDAPRDNPFDPNSDVYQYAKTLHGTIHRKIPPYVPIAGVDVKTMNPSYSTETDAKGYFEITQLPEDSITISISKDGYGKQQIRTLPSDDPLDIYLNAQPVLDTIKLTTNHQSHWWPVEDEYTVTIEALVSDPDGLSDIDSVWFWFSDPPIQLRAGQPFTADGYIKTEFYDWQLETPITDLIGKPLTGLAIDIDSLQSTPVTAYISRFIEATPIPISPVDNSQVGPLPTLRWDYFDASFTFYYSIEIFRITSGNTFTEVFSKDEIPQNTTEFTVTDSLETGSYYWTLGVVDALGNSTHSKEATFTVTQ